MSGVVSTSAEPLKQADERTQQPYAPSWVDHVTDWVRGLPFPAWVFYGGIAIALAAMEVTSKWIDGTYPFGQINPLHISFVLIGIYLLGALHYLDDTAAKALEQFRVALDVDDRQYADLRYQLTRLPARQTLLWSFAVLVLGIIAVSLLPKGFFAQEHLLTSPLPTVLEVAGAALLFVMAGAVAYHTFRQLIMVERIYGMCNRIDLFQLSPLYAFSKLTMRTAVVFLGGIYIWNIAPEMIGQPLAVLNTASAVGMAIACFVLPLVGIHELLEKEKNRVQTEASHLMAAAIGELDRRLHAGELTHMDEVKNTLESLTLKKAVLDGIRTWPWSAETPRLLGTAILLPLILFVIQRLLDSLLHI